MFFLESVDNIPIENLSNSFNRFSGGNMMVRVLKTPLEISWKTVPPEAFFISFIYSFIKEIALTKI